MVGAVRARGFYYELSKVWLPVGMDDYQIFYVLKGKEHLVLLSTLLATSAHHVKTQTTELDAKSCSSD